MSDPDKPKVRFGHRPALVQPSAEVVRLRRAFPPADQPDDLSKDEALKVVRMIAAETKNIVVVAHGKARQRQRRITRPQIERCIQKGVITEGPFLDAHANWQVNLTRYAAGEEITCVVAIEWVSKIVVIAAF
jgi:hypothetical protein